MMEHETLNYHPLVNTMTTSIERDDLVKFLRSTGHMPAHRAGVRAARRGVLTRLHSAPDDPFNRARNRDGRPETARDNAAKRRGRRRRRPSVVKDTTTQAS